MELNIDEVDVKTWNKLEDTAIKSGFRDGISDGRESNFQNSFDEGYKNGFESGFALGFYKGALSAQEDKKICNEKLLLKVTRGDCQMCRNNNLESEQISTLESKQKKNLEELTLKLKDKYKHIQYTDKNTNSVCDLGE